MFPLLPAVVNFLKEKRIIMFPDWIMSINIQNIESPSLGWLVHLDFQELNSFPGTGKIARPCDLWLWSRTAHGEVISRREILICGAIFGLGASQHAAAGSGWESHKASGSSVLTLPLVRISPSPSGVQPVHPGNKRMQSYLCSTSARDIVEYWSQKGMLNDPITCVTHK